MTIHVTAVILFGSIFQAEAVESASTGDDKGFIVASYSDHIARITSLDVEYVFETVPDSADAPSLDEARAKGVTSKKAEAEDNQIYASKLHRRWCRDGDKYLNGELLENQWVTFSFDGESTYNVRAAPDGQKYVQIGDPEKVSRDVSLDPEAIMGLKLYGYDGPLGELLARPDTELVGKVVVDDQECFYLRSAVFPSIYQVDARAHVILDVAHGYMPRRIAVGPPEYGLDADGGAAWYSDLRISEFKNVAPEGDPELWIARAATQHQPIPAVHHYTLVNASVNEQVDPAIFRPTIENGAQVLDVRGSVPRSFLAGTEEEFDEQIRALAKDAQIQAPSRFPYRLVLLILFPLLTAGVFIAWSYGGRR